MLLEESLTLWDFRDLSLHNWYQYVEGINREYRDDLYREGRLLFDRSTSFLSEGCWYQQSDGSCFLCDPETGGAILGRVVRLLVWGGTIAKKQREVSNDFV